MSSTAHSKRTGPFFFFTFFFPTPFVGILGLSFLLLYQRHGLISFLSSTLPSFQREDFFFCQEENGPCEAHGFLEICVFLKGQEYVSESGSMRNERKRVSQLLDQRGMRCVLSSFLLFFFLADMGCIVCG